MNEPWSLSFPQRIYRGSFLFEWRMRQASPPAPAHWNIRDPWRGKAVLGRPLVSGSHPSEVHRDDWHRFRWLRDMREFGGSQSRTASRRIVLEWLEAHGRWNATAWRPDVMAERLKMMALLWGWYGESASLPQQQSLLASMAVQRRCLEKDWPTLATGDERLAALSGLILSSLFLDAGADISTAAASFEEALSELVFGGGCHVSRRPDRHLDLLRILVETRMVAAASRGWGKESPPQVENTLGLIEDCIVRMGSVGRMWRHADGSFLAILGSGGVDSELADQVLALAGPEGKVTHHAGDSGFIRIASGRSLLMMNAAPPSLASAKTAAWQRENGLVGNDAGALAIEFSNGQNRIIVNGGAIDPGGNSDLQQALASTAAHSTLTLDDKNAADTDGGDRQAIGHDTETGPAEGGTLAVASHDGYEKTHSIVHTRSVFLATGGYDLRGEDELRYTGGPGPVPAEAVIRFHLNPRITPILSRGGDVTLRLPGSAAPWAFRSDIGRLGLEDSIVMGENGVERTQAVTLTIDAGAIRDEGAISIRWGLRRQQPGKKRQRPSAAGPST